jgi:glycosyltransferase domain-containing protein
VNFRGKIFIGDSSEATVAEKIKNSLQKFDNSLDIYYYPLPGYNAAQALKVMADKVTTKYAVFIADDDFLVPTGIGQCIEFLDTHPDYVAAHGIGIIIYGLGSKNKSIQYSGYYSQPIISEATAAQRLVTHLPNYTVSLFSVHRIEAWRTMFKDAGDIVDRSFGDELLPCCLSVVLGKTKQLDGLYLIRQDHGKRFVQPTWFEWITSEMWYPSYTAFCNYLAEAIARQDGITLEEAKDIVSQAFSVYLTQWISKSIHNPNPNPQWRSIAKQIPGARTIWHVLQSVLNKVFNDNKYYFGNMLKPESPYCNDFMLIYKIVTQRQFDII